MVDEIGFTLPKERRQQLYEALLSAFSRREELAIMINHKLDVNLEEIVATGDNLSIAVFKLIEWARSEGRITELVIGARKQKPGNPALRAFDEQFLHPVPSTPLKVDIGQMILSPGLLSGIGQDSFVDVGAVSNWYMHMRNAADALCRIELHYGLATGFLIGPTLALTCYHVVAPMIETGHYQDPITGQRTPLLPKSVMLRFGYARASDGITVNEGWACHLADDWLVDSSPVNELNYALLRVAGVPVKDWVTEQGERRVRSWLSPAQDYEFQPGSALIMLQHPDGQPLQVSYGTVLSVNDQGTSVSYMVPGAGGSSGAACFSAKWELVAMHQAKNSPYSWNSLARRGIPLTAIMSQTRVQAALAGT